MMLACKRTNKGCKGKKCCCARRTTIHTSVVESTVNHKGVDNGRNTTKVDGNGAVWSGSASEDKATLMEKG